MKIRFGRKKDPVVKDTAISLLALCDEVFTANRGLTIEGQGGVGDYLLKLAALNGSTGYVLASFLGEDGGYGLYPADKWTDGSYIDREGFMQHGPITEADAVRIITTHVPAPYL